MTVDTVIGNHSVRVYANDTSGNMGVSESVNFTIKSFPPSNTVTTDDLNSTEITSSISTPLPMILPLLGPFILSYLRRKDEGD